MSPLDLRRNIERWVTSLDNWPGDLGVGDQEYIHDVVALASGFTLDGSLGPCPAACRPYLRAMVDKVLVPLAVPVTLELELACAVEDQDP